MHGIQEHIASSDLKALKGTPLALLEWPRMETGIKDIDVQGSLQHTWQCKGSIRSGNPPSGP
jgi:hypothetical protein